MSASERKFWTAFVGVVTLAAVGAGALAAQDQTPPVPTTKPAPRVNVQAPGANVQVGVPGVNVQAGTYGYSQTPWFSNPTIREQLQLNDQQYNQLHQNYQKSWTRYNQERNLFNDKLTPEQRLRREGELSTAFHKDFSPAVNSVLADTAARQRYNQLSWQYQGYNAFRDPTVQQQLNLNAAQQQQLNKYGTAWDQQLNAWRTEYPNDQEQIGKQLAEGRREMNQRINSTLTPAQRNSWSSLSGQPYDFHPDVYFPPEPTPNTTLKPVIR